MKSLLCLLFLLSLFCLISISHLEVSSGAVCILGGSPNELVFKLQVGQIVGAFCPFYCGPLYSARIREGKSFANSRCCTKIGQLCFPVRIYWPFLGVFLFSRQSDVALLLPSYCTDSDTRVFRLSLPTCILAFVVLPS